VLVHHGAPLQHSWAVAFLARTGRARHFRWGGRSDDRGKIFSLSDEFERLLTIRNKMVAIAHMSICSAPCVPVKEGSCGSAHERAGHPVLIGTRQGAVQISMSDVDGTIGLRYFYGPFTGHSFTARPASGCSMASNCGIFGRLAPFNGGRRDDTMRCSRTASPTAQPPPPPPTPQVEGRTPPDRSRRSVLWRSYRLCQFDFGRRTDPGPYEKGAFCPTAMDRIARDQFGWKIIFGGGPELKGASSRSR